MKKLEGKLALVTGASAGIGAATARALAEAGARLVLVARREEKLEALAGSLPGSHETLLVDVRDANAVQSAFGELALDLVINNAGLARGVDPVRSATAEDVDEMVDTNVKGVLNVIRATLPRMMERRSGDMVLLGSVAGRQVYPGGGVYCATKHAVRALYEAMRIEAVGSGVRFTTVDPGLVQTDFSRVRFRGDEDRAAKVYQGLEPLRPEDVAEAILFAVTRPRHVNIGEIVMWATAQASTTLVARQSSAP